MTSSPTPMTQKAGVPLTIDEALLEIERLRALVEGRWKDAVSLRIAQAGPVGGKFEVALHSEILPLVAEYLASDFKRSGGENYVEIEVNHDELGPLTLSMQRRFGLMPAQVAANATLRAETAERRLREVTEALRGLIDGVTPEVNEKGAGGFLLARLSDARAALSPPSDL